jgi:hypothetical protein
MKHRVGEHAVGPRPGESWRGIHLLTGNNEQIDALTAKIPELAENGYAYPSHPEP